MSGGNPNHNPKDGRFSSGSESAAGSGDHGATSPSMETRNVPGHGTVLRSKVVAMHGHQRSVGTHGGGGGGGGGQSGGNRFGGSIGAKLRKRGGKFDETYGLKGGTPIGDPARPGATLPARQQIEYQQVQRQQTQFANTANAKRAR